MDSFLLEEKEFHRSSFYGTLSISMSGTVDPDMESFLFEEKEHHRKKLRSENLAAGDRARPS